MTEVENTSYTFSDHCPLPTSPSVSQHAGGTDAKENKGGGLGDDREEKCMTDSGCIHPIADDLPIIIDVSVSVRLSRA